MENICIAGASGFLGKNLSRYLSSSGYNILPISLRDEKWENQIVNNCEAIINLVGKAHDHDGKSSEKDYYDVNVDCTKKLFNAFLKSKSALFLHISSLAAVEESEAQYALDELAPCNPISWYGRSKRCAEEWLMSQTLPAAKKLVIIRPPMVHGAGDKGNLGLLYKLISKGIPYPLASFDNKRSFISTENFCYFLNQIIIGQQKLTSGIYHVCDDEPISTNEIIDIIKRVTNKKVINLSIPKILIKLIAKSGDFLPIPLNSKRLKKMTSNLLVSNAKIKTLLSIDKLPLTAGEGLEKTIESFRS
ncbi:NAD-dependent epimerase/dehydratase family protein [Sphingobacterium thalpophilum]|uniref:NAD-dependent epimerase/dehydratase family protein n=1 Tax=Sphingobacterium thalpophilum TaxID=259 RepID=UPI0037D9E82F